jgi:hypothetical protein
MEEPIIADNGNMSRDAKVSFSLMLPFRMQTRALTESDENAILSVRLLMFKEINGVKTYCLGVNGNNIQSGSISQKMFEATLPTGRYDIVVLANAQDIIDNSSISLGDTKENILGALAVTNVDKWNKNSIPMWGRIDGLTIDAATGLSSNHAVEMIRMLAKIDVEIASPVTADFALADVRLYGYSSQGALVPDMSCWSTGNFALAPTQPSAAGGYAPVSMPLVFDDGDGVTADGCRQMIYICEAPAGDGTNLAANTCLVIGGRYKGGAVTYYRIDFIGTESGRKIFLPLLRNNYYQVKVVSVSSNGYATPEGALAAPPVNMETVLLSWTGNGLNHVVFDGHYMLGVSTGRLELPADPQTIRMAGNKLTVMSTVPGGWTVEKITDQSDMPGTAGWLTLYSATPTATGELFVCVTENTSSVERTGYIHIRSGKLQYRVEVVQSAIHGFGLEIIDEQTWQEISVLDFGNTAGQEKSFKVIWKPATAKVTVTVSNPGSVFLGTGVPSNNTLLASPDGWYNCTVKTFAAPQGTLTRLDFTLSEGMNMAVKTLFIRQRK